MQDANTFYYRYNNDILSTFNRCYQSTMLVSNGLSKYHDRAYQLVSLELVSCNFVLSIFDSRNVLLIHYSRAPTLVYVNLENIANMKDRKTYRVNVEIQNMCRDRFL